ncbi:hypothetical protein Nepgr_021339 [Nepenthes gracilis]|uniref:Integrase catalytic domain-containing protein n=1 Tax=Nepenthes gracilis TaxID=150966 RepID=A0AAD3XW09_NEPGR|nr:hypothetical protein Nepgr_021339 [Nepenthes gracilis]
MEALEWVLHVEGSSTDTGSGAGVILMTPNGFEVKNSLRLDFPAINNIAKYEALLARIMLAKECSAKRLAVYIDIELIVNQVNGNFEGSNPYMAKYLTRVREATHNFNKLTLVHVLITENSKADQLARAAAAENPEQYLKDMMEKSINRFSVPEVVVTDNGTQFLRKHFTKYCTSPGSRLVHTSIVYPQVNGQVDVTNRTLLHGLKTKLDDAGGSWVYELASILWSYRTTLKEPTRETPFSLYYGTEAVILIEIGRPSLRVESFDPQGNSQKIREHLYLLEEARSANRMRTAAYHYRIARYYNKKVKAWQFDVGDLIL